MASTSGTKHSDHDEIRELFHHQRQEFASASMLENDLDLAYRLQLHEALTASTDSTPANQQMSTTKEVEQEEEDGVRALIRYMEEDLGRLEIEMSDREMSKVEARRIRDELNRRLHDRKVAAAILAVPDEEWEKNGDYFEKPYVSGKTKKSIVDESFRVYVKGIVSDVRVKDKVVAVAGIGVAICDPKDYCVLELRKPVVDENGGGSRTRKDVLSVERAGFEALVEGLKAAEGLGLKRISCFCDEYMIHQYVSTNQLSTDLKVTMLAFEALTLRKKLEQFDITLVGRNKIKVAAKLARDAVISQICKLSETKKGKKIVETCVICMDDTDVSDMFMVEGCYHRYCFSCMKQHVEVKLLNGKMPQCPHENCKSKVPLKSCVYLLEPKFVDLMIQRMKEAALPPTDKIYCPYPRCSALMSKKEVINNSLILTGGRKIDGLSICTKCLELFCRNCLVPWHKKVTCEAYQTSALYKQAEETKLKSLAKRKHWRQCVKCSNVIELLEGCYHIHCRCGYEFCYTCGAEWVNKKAKCACPLWDEKNIIKN